MPDGKWVRCGELEVMVEKSSALLGHKQEQTRMKVDGDHSQIAKLRPGQGGAYPNVLRIIMDALQSAAEQYSAAARKEVDGGPSVSPPSMSPPPDDSSSRIIPVYDDNNLTCDGCLNEFPKNRTHYNCIICDDGDFNLCQTCKKSGKSCPGKHKLHKRQLLGPESEDDDSDDSDDNNLICDECSKEFPKSKIHYHCIICDDGNFDLCQTCKKAGKSCPGKHKLYKRQLGDPATKGESDDEDQSASQGSTTKTSSSTQYCDIPGCKCGLPRKPTTLAPRKKKSEATKYCDIPGCTCSLPKKPTTPTSSKDEDDDAEDEICGLPYTCPVCDRGFQYEYSLRDHKKATGHDKKVESSSPTCRKCKRTFESKNKLFEHLTKSGHALDS
jgi:hypothetical protein